MMITPVLLCGGSGTRLWPLSRKSYPKQFAPLTGRGEPVPGLGRRLSGRRAYAPPVVVTASDFRFIVTEQLCRPASIPGAILIEPEARNTAPAILAAALHAGGAGPGRADAGGAVGPCDPRSRPPSARRSPRGCRARGRAGSSPSASARPGPKPAMAIWNWPARRRRRQSRSR